MNSLPGTPTLGLLTKTTIAVGLALSLSACVTTDGVDAFSRPAASPVDIGVDWGWSIAGDGAVRPLQVFSMKGKTYLQMRPSQVLPALMVAGEPVAYAINSPYLVIEGEPARIDVVAAGSRAVVTYSSPRPIPPAVPVVPEPEPSNKSRVKRKSSN